MHYIYDGFLQPQVAGYIRSAAEKYGYVIEFKELPGSWHDWSKNSLLYYNEMDKSIDGVSRERKTQKFMIVNNDEKSVFVFLKSKEEKEMVIKAWLRYIVNESPFKTVI